MITFGKKNNARYIKPEPLSTENYLKEHNVDTNAIEAQEQKSNLIEEFLEASSDFQNDHPLLPYVPYDRHPVLVDVDAVSTKH
jgi:hypothetical protein